MKLLFMTLLDFKSIEEHNIYTDLLREFRKNGHEVYVISPVERKENQETHLIEENGATILKLKIGNTQKTNIIEKGISTVMLEPTFIKGIKKYFSNVKFDLILYSTPPITFCGAIEFVKKRDNAKTYLLLKDIFPQNAVDMGMLSKSGVKGILYKYFRNKEKKLYSAEYSPRVYSRLEIISEPYATGVKCRTIMTRHTLSPTFILLQSVKIPQSFVNVLLKHSLCSLLAESIPKRALCSCRAT